MREITGKKAWGVVQSGARAERLRLLARDTPTGDFVSDFAANFCDFRINGEPIGRKEDLKGELSNIARSKVDANAKKENYTRLLQKYLLEKLPKLNAINDSDWQQKIETFCNNFSKNYNQASRDIAGNNLFVNFDQGELQNFFSRQGSPLFLRANNKGNFLFNEQTQEIEFLETVSFSLISNEDVNNDFELLTDAKKIELGRLQTRFAVDENGLVLHKADPQNLNVQATPALADYLNCDDPTLLRQKQFNFLKQAILDHQQKYGAQLSAADRNQNLQLLMQFVKHANQPPRNASLAMDLSGLNLSGADLTGADLTGADLTGATLDKKNLDCIRDAINKKQYVRYENQPLIYRTGNFAISIVPDELLYTKNLNQTLYNTRKAQIKKQNLQDSVKRKYVDELLALSKHLKVAFDLSDLNLSHADLKNLNLCGVNLRGAILDDADLTGAIIDDNTDLSKISAENLKCDKLFYEIPGVARLEIIDFKIFCDDFEKNYRNLILKDAADNSPFLKSMRVAGRTDAQKILILQIMMRRYPALEYPALRRAFLQTYYQTFKAQKSPLDKVSIAQCRQICDAKFDDPSLTLQRPIVAVTSTVTPVPRVSQPSASQNVVTFSPAELAQIQRETVDTFQDHQKGLQQFKQDINGKHFSDLHEFFPGRAQHSSINENAVAQQIVAQYNCSNSVALFFVQEYLQAYVTLSTYRLGALQNFLGAIHSDPSVAQTIKLDSRLDPNSAKLLQKNGQLVLSVSARHGITVGYDQDYFSFGSVNYEYVIDPTKTHFQISTVSTTPILKTLMLGDQDTSIQAQYPKIVYNTIKAGVLQQSSNAKFDTAQKRVDYLCDIAAQLGVPVDLSGMDCRGVDFSNKNLTGANLTGANLTGATLTAVNITGATLDKNNIVHLATAPGVIFDSKTPFTYLIDDGNGKQIGLSVAPEIFLKEIKKIVKQDFKKLAAEWPKTYQSTGNRLLSVLSNSSFTPACNQATYNLYKAQVMRSLYDVKDPASRKLMLQSLTDFARKYSVNFDLTGADVLKAKLTAQELNKIDLTGVKITGAQFKELCERGKTNFQGVMVVDDIGKITLPNKNEKINLTGADLSKAKFEYFDTYHHIQIDTLQNATLSSEMVTHFAATAADKDQEKKLLDKLETLETRNLKAVKLFNYAVQGDVPKAIAAPANGTENDERGDPISSKLYIVKTHNLNTQEIKNIYQALAQNKTLAFPAPAPATTQQGTARPNQRPTDLILELEKLRSQYAEKKDQRLQDTYNNLLHLIRFCKWIEAWGGVNKITPAMVKGAVVIKSTSRFFSSKKKGPLAGVNSNFLSAFIEELPVAGKPTQDVPSSFFGTRSAPLQQAENNTPADGSSAAASQQPRSPSPKPGGGSFEDV